MPQARQLYLLVGVDGREPKTAFAWNRSKMRHKRGQRKRSWGRNNRKLKTRRATSQNESGSDGQRSPPEWESKGR